MNTPELNEHVARVVARAQERNTRATEYNDGDEQYFEQIEEVDVIDMAIEELLDLINYATMIILRFESLRKRIEAMADKA